MKGDVNRLCDAGLKWITGVALRNYVQLKVADSIPAVSCRVKVYLNKTFTVTELIEHNFVITGCLTDV